MNTMKLLPNIAIKLILITSLILITDLLQTKPKAKLKSCETDAHCKTAGAEGNELCDSLPGGGVCVLPGEKATDGQGKPCVNDDNCPSALLCESGACKMINMAK
jgi:hypothetical protein